MTTKRKWWPDSILGRFAVVVVLIIVAVFLLELILFFTVDLEPA